MVPLRRQDAPPKSGPDIFVRRLRAAEKLTVQLISPSLWGCWVHWAGDHSEPCLEDKKKCPGHARGLPVKWKGYLHVINLHNRREEFLEMTPYSANMMLDQVEADVPLRGYRLQCERGKGDKARVKVLVLPCLTEASGLPQPVDPYKTLCNLWSCQGIDLRIYTSNVDCEREAV